MTRQSALFIASLILVMALSGCYVSQHWKTFRLDSIRPDASGRYDLAQMWYSTIDTTVGWELQSSIVACIADQKRSNWKTEEFGVVLRLMRVDSNMHRFWCDTMTITLLPDSTRTVLSSVLQELDTIHYTTDAWFLCFGVTSIPNQVDTLTLDFNLSTDAPEAAEPTKSYHLQLVRFEETFQLFAAWSD